MKFFRRKEKETDWSKYLGKEVLSKKQRLIRYASKKNISIYVDSPNEYSEGLGSMFRGVVSEAELEKRITEFKKLFWQRVAVVATIAIAVCGGLAWLYEKIK